MDAAWTAMQNVLALCMAAWLLACVVADIFRIS